MQIIVDKEYKWFIKSNGYVTAKINGSFVLLHRLLLEVEDDKEIDHVNQNKLDNRKSNLRFSNRIMNMHNVNYKKGSSGVTGVSLHSQNKNWTARIRINGKKKHLGSFSTKEEAGVAYQFALQNICQNQ